jgi:hypothetical protein
LVLDDPSAPPAVRRKDTAARILGRGAISPDKSRLIHKKDSAHKRRQYAAAAAKQRLVAALDKGRKHEEGRRRASHRVALERAQGEQRQIKATARRASLSAVDDRLVHYDGAWMATMPFFPHPCLLEHHFEQGVGLSALVWAQNSGHCRFDMSQNLAELAKDYPAMQAPGAWSRDRRPVPGNRYPVRGVSITSLKSSSIDEFMGLVSAAGRSHGAGLLPSQAHWPLLVDYLHRGSHANFEALSLLEYHMGYETVDGMELVEDPADSDHVRVPFDPRRPVTPDHPDEVQQRRRIPLTVEEAQVTLLAGLGPAPQFPPPPQQWRPTPADAAAGLQWDHIADTCARYYLTVFWPSAIDSPCRADMDAQPWTAFVLLLRFLSNGRALFKTRQPGAWGLAPWQVSMEEEASSGSHAHVILMVIELISHGGDRIAEILAQHAARRAMLVDIFTVMPYAFQLEVSIGLHHSPSSVLNLSHELNRLFDVNETLDDLFGANDPMTMGDDICNIPINSVQHSADDIATMLTQLDANKAALIQATAACLQRTAFSNHDLEEHIFVLEPIEPIPL